MIAAIVPACGLSTRMGRPKLLLPLYSSGRCVIEHVVTELLAGGVHRVIVVAPPADSVPGALTVADRATGSGAVVIHPEAPTQDMRATVEVAIDWLSRHGPPGWVAIEPADSPGLSACVVHALIAATRGMTDGLIVPRVGNRRGHPLILSWSHALRVRELPGGSGLNALLSQFSERVCEVDVNDPGVTADLDTPDDYRRWLEASR